MALDNHPFIRYLHSEYSKEEIEHKLQVWQIQSSIAEVLELLRDFRADMQEMRKSGEKMLKTCEKMQRTIQSSCDICSKIIEGTPSNYSHSNDSTTTCSVDLDVPACNNKILPTKPFTTILPNKLSTPDATHGTMFSMGIEDNAAPNAELLALAYARALIRLLTPERDKGTFQMPRVRDACHERRQHLCFNIKANRIPELLMPRRFRAPRDKQ